MTNEQNGLEEEKIETVFGIVTEETISKIVESFKDGLYSDLQQTPNTIKEVLDDPNIDMNTWVDNFIGILGEEIKPHLIKAMDNFKKQAKEILE